ncbi:MAG: hypothetical protein ACYTF0_04155 [Planctomycetota bacterium]|jgi:hypothetical protein
MLRWKWVLVLIVIGLLLTVYGVAIELHIRAEVGGGFKRWVATTFYREDISWHRYLSQTSAVLGPALIIGSLLLLRRWSHQRWAAWWGEQAQRHHDKAATTAGRRATKHGRRAEACQRRAEHHRDRDQRHRARGS